MSGMPDLPSGPDRDVLTANLLDDMHSWTNSIEGWIKVLYESKDDAQRQAVYEEVLARTTYIKAFLDKFKGFYEEHDD
jgi:hypothetical protein